MASAVEELLTVVAEIRGEWAEAAKAAKRQAQEGKVFR